MRDVLQQESLYYFVILHQSVYLNFMLAFAIKAKKTSSDLYNSVYTSSYTNGIQYSVMYVNLRQLTMGKINC